MSEYMRQLAAMMVGEEDTGVEYAWIITKDYLADKDERGNVGTVGPRNAPDNLIAELNRGHGIPFRMYDDDSECYYAGKIMIRVEGKPIATTDDLPEEAFGPLSDFGEPNDGCTEIKYRIEGRWATL